MKWRGLDLFCGGGGCTRGYQNAGFIMDGVDNRPQPRYCGESFFLCDALEFCDKHGREYDFIHASPVCKGYSKTWKINKAPHPKIIQDVRVALIATGKPYIIENVPGAPLINPVTLTGTMFNLGVVRDRLFECSFPVEFTLAPIPGNKIAKMGRRAQGGEYMHVAGHFTDIENARRAMGIDWMTRDELAQAIPPAYTEFIGKYLMKYLQEQENEPN